MPTRRPHRAVVLASLAALGLAVPPAVAQAPRTIAFKEKASVSRFDYVDNPPRGKAGRPRPSAGDLITLTLPLFGNAGARRGTLRATCTIMGVSAKAAPAICYGVVALKEGQLVIVVSSSNIDAKTTVGMVVGGSRAYANARGSFTSVSTKAGANDTITLTG
jgi:hypothetical protein